MLLDKFDEFPIKNEVRPSIFFFEVEAGIIDSFLDIKEWEFKFILFLNQRKDMKFSELGTKFTYSSVFKIKFLPKWAGRILKHCQNFQDSYNQQGKEAEHSDKTK
ncbi:uncharacterized protein OCT59_024691 [Rhizophagus irregularis]|uniref:uncharacterized protein n=1 Tax=Rhizophagus irregularis TaxID=588596 RepID=UPI00331E1FBD|nr:hypothetical protein OCT59_024691 [Rhizophagus irregularis]